MATPPEDLPSPTAAATRDAAAWADRECVVRLDAAMQVIATSSAAEDELGVRAGAGRLGEQAGALDFAALEAEADVVASRGEAAECELRGMDGRWWLVRLRPCPLRPGESGVSLHFLDATDRHRAEAALRRREATFRMLAEEQPALVWIIDGDGTALWFNRHCRVFFGEGVGGSDARRWREAVHPEDDAKVDELAEAVRARHKWQGRTRVRRGDGAWRWIETRGFPLISPSGEALGYAVHGMDVTERELAQHALVGSEERLRLVIENAREYAIFSTDLQRRVLSWNAGAERILGWTPEEIIGAVADVIFTPEDVATGVPAAEAATAAAEGRAEDERWHVRRDGTRFWGSGSLMAMHDAEGAVVGFVKIFRDKTAARAASEELKRSRHELLSAARENERARSVAEAASQAKDDFLAALSHELRTPLNPVLITVAALEQDPAVSEAARGQLTMVRRHIELEARLIDDLLDVTKISRGRLSIDPVPCDAHELLREAACIVTSGSADAAARLVFELEAAECWVLADPPRLQQVFWNVLKNAFKFSPEGGPVTVRTVNDGAGTLVISVTDAGLGVSPESAERIFQPFDQGDLRGRHRFGGLGLGLAISRAITELHGGSLAVRSAGAGRGATFSMTLETTREPPGPAAVAAGAEAGVTTRPLRLLVVEDHEPTLDAMVRLLERDGHRVSAATTLAAAEKLAATEGFDLLISDIALPDGSGLDLMRRIKQRHGWPGIALSGYGMANDVRECCEVGFEAHLTKPIKMSTLRQTIRQVLRPTDRA